ncbi:hypothetical protein HYW53_02850 [Candidatus Giovannonibacteria bacterium]|nr:hypothetical protein [Candidatus Giovannonibacteria bacterium]
MSSLFSQLGVNWKLLLAQGVNFLIILTVLTVFVYRPLLKIVEERKKRIEFGLKGAEEADRILKEIDDVKKEKLSEAEKKALEIITLSEKEAAKKAVAIVTVSEKKAEGILKEASEVAKKKRTEELDNVKKEAEHLIKEALIKTVELSPRQVDENLIGRALEFLGKKA